MTSTAVLAPEIEARLTTSALWSRLDPASVMSEVCGLTPDPWQARMLRLPSTGPTRHRMLLKPRQVGGSELAVAEIARCLLAGKLAVIMSPAERQSIRLLKRDRRALTRYALTHPEAAPTNHALLSLTLKTGGEAVALGAVADTARGFDGVALLVLDEIAFFPEQAMDDVARAIIPAIGISGGRILALTTAGFTGTWAHRVLTGDVAGFDLTRVGLDECPRWTPQAIAELRAMIGEAAARVELDMVWRTPDESGAPIWSSAEIAAALGLAPVPDNLPGEPYLPPDDDEMIPRQGRIWTPDTRPDRTAARSAIGPAAPARTATDARGARRDPVSARPAAPARRSAIRSLAALLADDDTDDWTAA